MPFSKEYYKKYKPELTYSYTLGLFPTIELLHNRPSAVKYLAVHSTAWQSEAGDLIRTECKEHGILPEVNDKLMERLSLKENIHCIAIFEKYESKLHEDKNHLVLVNPADMGNLGTIIRTMLAFGYKDLALIKPAADVFNPKTLRAAMGANFQVRVQYFASFAEYQSQFEREYYPFMLEAETELAVLKPAEKYSLIFGNESSGLTPNFQQVGTPVKITQSDAVDSLNLSVACGIALHALKLADA